MLRDVGFGRGRAVLLIQPLGRAGARPPPAERESCKYQQHPTPSSSDLPVPSAHLPWREGSSLSQEACSAGRAGVQQQPPPLGCKYQVHSEQQLPSCQVIIPWCLNVIGIKLTPVHLIPSGLTIPQEHRFLINLNAQASFAIAAFHGASSWGNVFL